MSETIYRTKDGERWRRGGKGGKWGDVDCESYLHMVKVNNGRSSLIPPNQLTEETEWLRQIKNTK